MTKSLVTDVQLTAKRQLKKYNLCYVNYDAEDDVRTIEFDDFQVGDDVIIGLYDGEKENAFNKSAVAEQVQLATQRLN